MFRGQIKIFFGFLAVTLLFICSLASAASGQTVEGRILQLDSKTGTVTILDISDRKEKTIQVKDIKGLEKDSYVKMQVSVTDTGAFQAKQIERLNKWDCTGMKRRLKKALSGMKHHRPSSRGHRGRCRRR